MSGPLPVAVGDVAWLRKMHPCGGFEWHVTRIGADIGLCCATCGRKILLPRDEFERRVRRVTHPNMEEPKPDDADM